jgi:hypothetical protein
MPRTTEEAVRLLLSQAGIAPTSEQIEQAIADASLWVDGYDLSFSGVTTDVAPGKLIDASADFSGVRVGAKVLNKTTGARTTVTAVDSPTTLSLAQDIFPEVAPYSVEDVARAELAERYKAASLLAAAASGAARGIESASLGPMRLTFGTNTRTDQFPNEFERRYCEIVGPVALV